MNNKEFETLIAASKSIVFAAIRSHLHKDLYDYIDDVAQESYLKLFRRLKKVSTDDDIEKMQSYIFIVAKNESLRINKREKKYLAVVDEKEQYYTEKQDLFSTITPIIMSLPEKYKSVTSLFYIQGLSLSEISKELSISVQAIKSRLFRGRKLLIKQAKHQQLIKEAK